MAGGPGLIITTILIPSVIGCVESIILLVLGALLVPGWIPEHRRVPAGKLFSMGIVMFFWGFVFHYSAWGDINSETGSYFVVAIACWGLGAFYFIVYLYQYYYQHNAGQPHKPVETNAGLRVQ